MDIAQCNQCSFRYKCSWYKTYLKTNIESQPLEHCQTQRVIKKNIISQPVPGIPISLIMGISILMISFFIAASGYILFSLPIFVIGGGLCSFSAMHLFT